MKTALTVVAFPFVMTFRVLKWTVWLLLVLPLFGAFLPRRD